MIPESYLSHAFGEQRANHRYIARVPIGNNRNRYFYSIDEYRAFRNGGRKSLGDRLDAARSKAAKNVGDVSKTIANRNQAVKKKAEDATWNALSRINKGLSGRSTPKTTNQVKSTGGTSHSTKIFRDYVDTMTDPKKRSQQLQNEKDRNRRMTDQGVIGEMKRGYNGIVDDMKSTKDRAVSSVKRDYEGMKKDVDKVKKTVSDTKNDLGKSIKRPIDSGVDKNSAMKKQIDAMKKANRAMNIQTNYKGGYNIKPLTNLDVISTTAAKGAANVANRVSAQAATKTKEHMAEAKKQVNEGVKRSENYWSKKKDTEKDVADAYDEVSKKIKSTADKGKDFINDLFDKAKDAADDVVDTVKSTGKEASSRASKKFEELGSQVKSKIEKAMEPEIEVTYDEPKFVDAGSKNSNSIKNNTSGYKRGTREYYENAVEQKLSNGHTITVYPDGRTREWTEDENGKKTYYHDNDEYKDVRDLTWEDIIGISKEDIPQARKEFKQALNELRKVVKSKNLSEKDIEAEFAKNGMSHTEYKMMMAFLDGEKFDWRWLLGKD